MTDHIADAGKKDRDLSGWQDWSTVPRDGSWVIAELGQIADERFSHWSGRKFVVRHGGYTRRMGYDLGWQLFPGMGCGDEWFLRWHALP